MKNRTIIGIVCIALALAVTFGVAPIVNKLADSRTDIVRITKDVNQGHLITEEHIQTVTVGSHNLPSNIITKKESVIGKYAACDLKSGDYLLPSKVSETADSAEDIFRTLNGEKQAISITISSFAGGLSGKLKNGDIVSLIIYDDETDSSYIPRALTYVKVITSTTDDGIDKDELTQNEDGTYELPTTLTLLVTPAQAKLLVSYENKCTIHADLVYRGDSKTAQKFLDAQDLYLENYTDEKDNTGSSGKNVNDIVKDANDIIWGNIDKGGDD